MPLTFRVSTDAVSFDTSARKNGLTVNFVSVGADGKVKADVAMACAATTATFTLKATS